MKPLVSAYLGVSEGVFAASGDSSGSGEGVTYTVNQTNAWDGHKQYDIYVTNNTSEKLDSVTVEIPVSGDVTYIGGNWNTAVVSGSVALLTSNNWGNGINAGDTIQVYTEVMGNGDFSLG